MTSRSRLHVVRIVQIYQRNSALSYFSKALYKYLFENLKCFLAFDNSILFAIHLLLWVDIYSIFLCVSDPNTSGLPENREEMFQLCPTKNTSILFAVSCNLHRVCWMTIWFGKYTKCVTIIVMQANSCEISRVLIGKSNWKADEFKPFTHQTHVHGICSASFKAFTNMRFWMKPSIDTSETF